MLLGCRFIKVNDKTRDLQAYRLQNFMFKTVTSLTGFIMTKKMRI